MVLFLLLGLAAITWSGLMVYAYDQQAGPLARFVSPPVASAPGIAVRDGADTDDAEDQPGNDDFQNREEYWEEVHELFVNLTLILVILHIAGVLLASVVHRENLVVAMLSGRKRPLAKDRHADV